MLNPATPLAGFFVALEFYQSIRGIHLTAAANLAHCAAGNADEINLYLSVIAL